LFLFKICEKAASTASFGCGSWLLFAGLAAHAGVVSQQWGDGKLALTLDDGAAEIEWLTPTAFRFARSWNGPIPVQPKIAHEKIDPQFQSGDATLSMRSKYITATVNRDDLKLSVTSGETAIAWTTLAKTVAGAQFRVALGQDDRIYGLLGGSSGRLNIRGEKIAMPRGFLFTSAGYGIYVRSASACSFDMADGVIDAPGASSIEYFLYYGPTAKEMLEQHANVIGQAEVQARSLDLLSPDKLPKEAAKLPEGEIRSWDALTALVRRLNQWALSAVIYPALDIASFDGAPAEIKQRAEDLSTLLPLVYRGAGEGGIDVATRARWTPYLTTYLREAFDRGFPLIRPLAMQFSKDATSDRQADVFMLGDEVLLAPVLGPGTRRKLDLPRGLWTDFRTNQAYHGNQSIEVDAPPGGVPMFVRNGWIVPLAEQGKMDLHYFPSLGAEFFLWESDLNENSQFHAAPAGDFLRLEIESKKRRTYEWIVHHLKTAREVADEAATYQKVAQRALLKPGTWWHDDAQNNLHVMLRAEADSDRIVNISF
jgi:alpha-glucosidase (family GH31 glycosyl hydrolase)